MQSRVGVAPVQNNVTFIFCFGGKMGLLQAAITPAYRAHFAGSQPFKNKMVARGITATFAPGTTITAKITELSELTNPDDALFKMETPTSAAEQMKASQVGEDTTRALALNTPAIVWPPVREGKTSGVMSLYISNDRAGHVREVWPVASDNPALNDAAQEQVLRWQYKPYTNGGPAQMEAVLTFAFTTRIENPIPVLNDKEARKLATRAVEALVPSGKARRGTRFTLRVSVDEAGKVQNVQNPNSAAPALYSAGSTALKKWGFHPYINKGKPDRFYADITFLVR
jgi:outer membrane biosynthesis protein TonB